MASQPNVGMVIALGPNRTANRSPDQAYAVRAFE